MENREYFQSADDNAVAVSPSCFPANRFIKWKIKKAKILTMNSLEQENIATC